MLHPFKSYPFIPNHMRFVIFYFLPLFPHLTYQDICFISENSIHPKTDFHELRNTMTPGSLNGKRLVGIFIIGLVLFNYPILSLFNLKINLFGIPLIFLYLYSTWILLIGLIIFITGFRIHPSNNKSSEPDK